MVERVSSPIFVGRSEALARVDAAFAAVRAGVPSMVLVAGEAGVGKSRFIREVALRARKDGALVLEGGCLPAGADGLPFGPIVEALRGLDREIGRETLLAAVGSGRAELSRLMPVLARADDVRAADGSAQLRLFEHLLLLLEALAARQPVVLMVEDLHWSDRATLELLGFLSRNIRSSPILVIGTFRTDELDREHRLQPFLAEQERSGRVTRIDLERFSLPELREQLTAILGASPDAATVDRILRRSDGNAFYAEELLASTTPSGQLPDTLRDLLLARVTGLSDTTQEFLRIASVSGPEVRPGFVGKLQRAGSGHADSALREAIAHHILVPSADGAPEHYAFRHALVQEALYSQLLPGERTRFHSELAEALARSDHAGDARTAAEIANHREASHDEPGAFDAWIAAGIAAERIGAFGQALGDFEHALDLWDHVPDADSRAPITRIEMLQRAALLAEGATPRRSVEFIEAALDLVDESSDPVTAGLLYERLGHASWYAGDTGSLRRAYEEGVRLVPAEPPTAARAIVLAGLGRYLVQEDPATNAAIAVCESALRVAEAAGAREVESRALVPLGRGLVDAGRVDEAMAAFERGYQMAAALGDTYEVANCLAWWTGALVDSGRFPEAIAMGRRGEAYAAEHGLGSRWATVSIFWMTEAQFWLGQWSEVREALTRAQRFELHEASQMLIQSKLFWLDLEQGMLAAASEHLHRLHPFHVTKSGWLTTSARAAYAFWSGDPRAATAATLEVLESLASRPDGRVLVVGPAIALGLAAEGDLVLGLDPAEPGFAGDVQASVARADRLLDHMRVLEAEIVATRPFYSPWARTFLFMCEGERARLTRTPRPDLWAAAASFWQARGVPFYQAFSHMREGEAALQQRRDRPRAAQALMAGHEVAMRLGAEIVRRQIEALAERANIRLGAAKEIVRVADPGDETSRELVRTPSARGRYDLTPREVEVLGLLSTGLTDGEIAERLFISKKTASVHVNAIKGKLGSRSRVEIVTDAIGLGLAPVPASAPGE